MCPRSNDKEEPDLILNLDMPLKCFRNDEAIFAFDTESDAAWQELRNENAANQSLKMPCCGAGVTLRTSKLGTKHFAHARRGPCATAPETAEHLLAKLRIVEGIRRTDWAAFPEQTGESPGFGAWTADVLATKVNRKVAFEVQWSSQDKAETQCRQARYKAAGVRGLWLFRQHDFPIDKDTPAFRLTLDEQTNQLMAQLPSSSYSEWMRAKDKNEPRYWQQSIELSKFVEGALTGRLRFAPALGAIKPVEIHTAPTMCWKCQKETRVVMSLVFAASRVFPGCADIELTIHSFADDLEDGVPVVMGLLPAPLMKRHGVGAIKPRYSKTDGRSYLSNGCAHCDALQGKFFEHELAYDTEKTLEVEAKFEKEWGPRLEDAESEIYRWWFDETASRKSS
jgi:competence protein CoiA